MANNGDHAPSGGSTTEHANIIRQGFLKKEGKIFKTWNKRWFVMDDWQTMSYYEKKGGKMKGSFTFAGSAIRFSPERENKKRRYMFVIETPGRVFYLCADSANERDDWINVLQSQGVQLKETPTLKSNSDRPATQSTSYRQHGPNDAEEEDQTMPTSADSSPRSSVTNEELAEMAKEELREEASHLASQQQTNTAQSSSSSSSQKQEEEEKPQPSTHRQIGLVRRETVATNYGDDTYETFTQVKDGDISDEDEKNYEDETDIRSVNQYDTNEEEDPTIVVGMKEPVGVKDALERMEKHEKLENIAVMCCRYLSDRLANDPKLVEAFIENQAIQILLGIGIQHKKNRSIIFSVLRVLSHLISLSHSESWKVLVRLNGGHRLALSILRLHHEVPEILKQALFFVKLLFSGGRADPPEEFFTKESLRVLLSALEKHISDIDIVTNCISFCSHVSVYPNGLNLFIRQDGMRIVVKALMRWLQEIPHKILPVFWQFSSRISKPPTEPRSRTAQEPQTSSNSSSDKVPASIPALESLSQAVMAYGVVNTLLMKTMRTYSVDKELVKTAIACLKTLATSSPIIAEIVHILKTNIKDRGVAYNVALLMYNLRQSELLPILSSSDLIEAITPTLREYNQDENLMLFVLCTLKFLLYENEDNQKKFVEVEGLGLLIRITRAYCTKLEICTVAVEILFYLSDNDDYTAAMGQEKGGIEAIMEVIDNNEHNDDILSSSLKILVDLAVVSDIDEEQQKDILSLMISFLKERKDSGMVAEKSMIVLYIVSEKYDPFELQNDEVEILLDCVKMHSSNDRDFVTVVFDLFGTLSKLPQNREYMEKCGAPEILDNLASEFEDDEKIQISAQQFQENMCLDMQD